MVVKIRIEDLVNQAKKWINEPGHKRRAIIIPEKNYDSFKEFHPLESYFIKNGVAYDFDKGIVDGEEIYSIDLNKMKVIYPK